jgi:hypothetical protein
MLHLLAQTYTTTTNSGGGGAAAVTVSVIILLIYLAVIVLMIASSWKVFTKAGKPGWASIVPIYNTIVQLEIIGRPIWWLILLLIPFVNIIFLIIVTFDLAKVFGKDMVFGLLLLFVPIIGYPMLAFGNATYQGPIAGGNAGTTAANLPSSQGANTTPEAIAPAQPVPTEPEQPKEQF